MTTIMVIITGLAVVAAVAVYAVASVLLAMDDDGDDPQDYDTDFDRAMPRWSRMLERRPE